jgi:RNA polymerase sigma-70 factor (ECF subfamily)
MMVEEITVESANLKLSDEEVVRKVIEGESSLFEILMSRYNRRLFRVTRSIVTNDLEAEDIIQDAYVRAYEHPNPFEGLRTRAVPTVQRHHPAGTIHKKRPD